MSSQLDGVVFGVFIISRFLVVLQTANPLREQGLALCESYSNRLATNMIQCNLTHDQFLDYKEVRLWTEKEKDKFSVKIACTGGGAVHLPWPFTVKNVISLEVYGCLLQGFLSEMMTQPSHPHELKTLILSSVSIDLPFNAMVALQNNVNNVPVHTDCGPTTLETLVLRDIHYDLKVTPEDRDKLGSIQLGRSAAAKHVTAKRCVFPHLRYIDESGSRKNGKSHLKLIPEYSEFPLLEVYNMSNNNLVHIPPGFQHLHSKKFPMLKYVDFSNNALKTFEFEFPEHLSSCNLQLLDLRSNHVTAMSRSSVRQLQRLGSLLVDLRDNPLRCDCVNAPFSQLLRRQFQGTTDHRRKKLLSDVTCEQRDYKTGVVSVNMLNVTLGTECFTNS